MLIGLNKKYTKYTIRYYFIVLGEYPIDIDFGQRSHQFATPHVGRLQIQVDKIVPVLSKSWFGSPENNSKIIYRTGWSKLYGIRDKEFMCVSKKKRKHKQAANIIV